MYEEEGEEEGIMYLYLRVSKEKKKELSKCDTLRKNIRQ